MSATKSQSPSLDRHSEAFVDLLRGVAALMVMLGHSTGLAIRGVYGEDPAGMPTLWRWIHSTLGFGGFWVWAFFVMSGLCIQQSIARSLERGSFAWSSYLAARVTRIYPLFLVGLALVVGGWWLTSGFGGKAPILSSAQIAGTVLMVQLFSGTLPGFSPSWSLTNEMAYYVLWPAGLKLFKGKPRKAALVLTAGALAATAIIVFVWKKLYHGVSPHPLIPCWGLSAPFVIWLVGAWLGIDWASIVARVSRRLWLASIAWLALIYAMVGLIMYLRLPAAVMVCAGYFATPGFIVLIAGSRHFTADLGGRWRSFAVAMGVLSYPCYILHEPLLWISDAYIAPLLTPSLAAQPVVRWLLTTAPVALVVGTLGVRLETFFMLWRKGVLRRAGSAAQPAVA
jgi:peptidoglycan/LPS O-acetylase OafA/YrhL